MILVRHSLAVLGYVVATFATQATSHFVLFQGHYAAVPYIKSEPVFMLGLLSMLIQGTILSLVFSRSWFAGKSMLHAVALAWLFGLFLVSYIGLAEAAKYAVPSIRSWIGVEFLAGAVQFTLAGVFLALAHRVGAAA